MANVIAASWNGGTVPVAAVSTAKSDQSNTAPKPLRVAEDEDITGLLRVDRRFGYQIETMGGGKSKNIDGRRFA
jgi:hypothetical protein